ncbi:hypothetical protein L249_0311 [Ophiocordyceps polyrhachis-furcata BCC 54312]|uniref:Uncharacterized protein n=1 Tax=Ophiocordyceps polyrhachis-furcata BCC 54312 TaxID=1330021 RepID=A0A367LDQ9_9HYPO|nr:hypothetical protein L249_0311 [Ophiocordyceps polyrhachis-furcata BCC 54312]
MWMDGVGGETNSRNARSPHLAEEEEEEEEEEGLCLHPGRRDGWMDRWGWLGTWYVVGRRTDFFGIEFARENSDVILT